MQRGSASILTSIHYESLRRLQSIKSYESTKEYYLKKRKISELNLNKIIKISNEINKFKNNENKIKDEEINIKKSILTNELNLYNSCQIKTRINDSFLFNLNKETKLNNNYITKGKINIKI